MNINKFYPCTLDFCCNKIFKAIRESGLDEKEVLEQCLDYVRMAKSAEEPGMPENLIDERCGKND